MQTTTDPRPALSAIPLPAQLRIPYAGNPDPRAPALIAEVCANDDHSDATVMLATRGSGFASFCAHLRPDQARALARQLLACAHAIDGIRVTTATILPASERKCDNCAHNATNGDQLPCSVCCNDDALPCFAPAFREAA